jgi:HAD superfamily hydrolase (TIGR01509 family)
MLYHVFNERTPHFMMDTAYLFDLDGTLILTDHLHLDLWRTILATYRIDLDEDMYRSRIRGKTDAVIWDDFGVGTAVERAEHSRWKEQQFEQRILETIPVKGGKELMEALQKKDIWTGVVTNSNSKTAGLLLLRLGLDSMVDVFITADDCSDPKPSPAPYLMALHELGVEPDHATLFEDSPIGIASALAVGPKALYIVGDGNAEEYSGLDSLQPIFINDFTALTEL